MILPQLHAPVRLQALVIAAVAIAAVAGAGEPHPSNRTITVTRLDDPVPDGCSPDDCSLREAVILANSVAPATVRLAAGTYRLELEGRYEDESMRGDLDITANVSIVGAGSSLTKILAPHQDRVIEVPPSGSATISHLAVASVWYSLPPINCGGGIRNDGSARLVDVLIEKITFRGSGAGICNQGVLEAEQVTIIGARAAWAGDGGALYNSGTAAVTRSALLSSRAEIGHGGGVYNIGTLLVEDSTISGNGTIGPFGDRTGGGIHSKGSVTLRNVTVSGNRTEALPTSIGRTDSRGGGLYLQGDATLTNVTITGNESETTAGGLYYGGGGTLTLVNTIIAGNTGGDCEGFMISGGHNIDGDGSCGLGAAGDMPNTDPLLAPLADNGGPTQTHALLAGSPAIDAGEAAACPPGDQRGYLRPAGAGCDIGAFEFDAVAPSPSVSPSPTASAAPVAQGDADCDGHVDPVDALAALRLAAGLNTEPACLVAANVDCSLAVDAVDALLILRYVAALPVTPPPGCPQIGAP